MSPSPGSFATPASADDQVRRRLTWRYALALVLIGVVLLGQQGLSSLQIGARKSDGHLINVSGMQRLLSQRIAMIANDVVQQENDTLRADGLDALEEAVARMDANHAELLQDWTQRSARDESYFNEVLDDSGIALRIEDFVSSAHSVLDGADGSDIDKLIARNTALSLAVVARGDFLDGLDATVKQYESISLDNLTRLQSIVTVSVLSGLILLIAVALLIFRPMVDQIIATFASLRQSRDEQYELGRRMSHDLRAPIASSLGVVSIIEEAVEEGELDEVREASSRLHVALSRLDTVLAQLMAVTRLHRTTPTIETVDLAALLPGTIEEAACDARVMLDNTVGEPVLADRDLLGRALFALLHNAVKFSDGPRPEITVRAWIARNTLHVSVQDAGIGIPGPCRSRVFRMFQQFHPDRSDGAGLGLYLALVSVRTMSGHISYEPLAGGSRFTLSIPQKHGPRS